MENQYFKALGKAYFPAVKQYLSTGRYFYVDNGHIFVLMNNGNVMNFGSDISRVSSLIKSGFAVPVEATEFNHYYQEVLSGSVPQHVPNQEVKATTTNYQRIATTVGQDQRFDVIDSQRAFNQSTRNTTPNITANSPDPRSLQASFGATTGTLVEKYQTVQLPEAQKVGFPTLGDMIAENAPANSLASKMPVVPVEFSFTAESKKSDFDKAWDSFMGLKTAQDKAAYLDKLSFVSVLEFFQDKLGFILSEESDVKITKKSRPQYEGFLATVQKKLSNSRMELKV